MDSVEHGERVEGDLNRLIERRHDQHRQSEEDKRVEELWMPTVRAYQQKRDEAQRLEKLAWHEGQITRLSNTFEALISHHEREAERYQNGHEENGHRKEGSV